MDKVLSEIHSALGINESHLLANRLTLQKQPRLSDLQVVEIDFEGKPFVLCSTAARAWYEMKAAAQDQKIALMPFSGFRSYLQQKNLIARHLQNGRSLDDILKHIAIPGFSEHHTGRAVDIHADGPAVLDEAFEKTAAFSWLSENAERFAFRLSYPRANSFGIIYEPWHWFFTGH